MGKPVKLTLGVVMLSTRMLNAIVLDKTTIEDYVVMDKSQQKVQKVSF